MKQRIFFVIALVLVFGGNADAADKVPIGVSNYTRLILRPAWRLATSFSNEKASTRIIRMNPNVATMALVSSDVD